MVGAATPAFNEVSFWSKVDLYRELASGFFKGELFGFGCVPGSLAAIAMSVILAIVRECGDSGVLVWDDFPSVYVHFLATVLVTECTSNVKGWNYSRVLSFSTFSFQN